MAAAAPAAPATAMTGEGPRRCARALAITIAAPWPSRIPPIVSPNAWPRWLPGTAATNEAFA